jgi:hypothetical protein
VLRATVDPQEHQGQLTESRALHTCLGSSPIRGDGGDALKGVVPLYLAVSHTKVDPIGEPPLQKQS